MLLLGGSLGVLGLSRSLRVLRLLRLSGRLLGLGGGLGVLRLSRDTRLDRLGRSLRVLGHVGLGGVLRLGLRDNNDRRLARVDGLRRADRLGKVDRRVNGLALSVGALLVGVAVVLAGVKVVAVLINVADKLAGILLRSLTDTAGAVADDSLVEVVLLVVRVVAASVLANLDLVPGIIVALTRSTEVILANNLPLGAGRAVDLGSTVVTVADNDNVGRNNRQESDNGLGSNNTALSEGNGSGGGGSIKGLGDDVGVDDSVGGTGVDTDGDVDGEKDVDVNALAAHDARASDHTTAVLGVIARADDVTEIGADRLGQLKVELGATVAAAIVETEEVGASTGLSTLIGVVVLAVVSKREAREAIARVAAEEVETGRVSDATSGAGGGSSSGSLGAGSLGTDSSCSSLHGSGVAVNEAHGGESVGLSGSHLAHGKGEDIGVTHLEG